MRKYLTVAPLAVAAGSVFAAVPTEVTTAISEGKTDMITVAGLMLGVFIALVGFKLIRRAAH